MSSLLLNSNEKASVSVYLKLPYLSMNFDNMTHKLWRTQAHYSHISTVQNILIDFVTSLPSINGLIVKEVAVDWLRKI